MKNIIELFFSSTGQPIVGCTMYSALQGRLKVRGGTGGCALSTLHCVLCVVRCACECTLCVCVCRAAGGNQGRSWECSGIGARGKLAPIFLRDVSRPRRTCGRENLKCRLHLKEDYLTFLLSSKPLSIIPLNSDLNNKFFSQV